MSKATGRLALSSGYDWSKRSVPSAGLRRVISGRSGLVIGGFKDLVALVGLLLVQRVTRHLVDLHEFGTEGELPPL